VNPHFRTAALIAASLGLLVSLYFALNPRDEDEAAPATTATTAPAATTTAPATTAPAATETEPPPATTAPQPPAVVRMTVAVGPNGVESVRRFSVRQGRVVALVVRSALTDHVHVHGYDLMADVAPGAPATIRFTADAPGRFEIELEESGLQIAELEVRP
jgi:hypothetical protein